MKFKNNIVYLIFFVSFLCIRQLSHSLYVYIIDKKVYDIQNSNLPNKNKLVYNLYNKNINLGIINYNYFNSKNNCINLGLDLKGGLNLIMQISQKDILNNLFQDNNKLYSYIIKSADSISHLNHKKSYLDIFLSQLDKLSSLGKIKESDLNFFRKNLNIDKFNSIENIKKHIKLQVDARLSKSYDIIRSRIDKFGVYNPLIQKIDGDVSGKILLEMPGISDAERVKRLLKSTAKLEFWEAIKRDNLFRSSLFAIDISKYKIKDNKNNYIKSLSYLLKDMPYSNAMFYSNVADTSYVNNIIKDQDFISKLPSNLENYKFAWSNKPVNLPIKDLDIIELYILKGENNKPLISGDKILSANSDVNNNSVKLENIVSMKMNDKGAKEWAIITDKMKPSSMYPNGGSIAIVLDNVVYSSPNVKSKINSNISQISGNFSSEESNDLANILNAGAMPASSKILSTETVGPSLGVESINKSIIAFCISFLAIVLWMFIYYGRAGIYSIVALFINLILLLGIMISLKAVISLPSIAGIILTLVTGMDANILIYERIKEELKKGKNLKGAIIYSYSWNGAISAIFDANFTSLLTALVLIIFGKGAISSFATTYIIGIFTSSITSIFITNFFIYSRLSNKKILLFNNRINKFFLDLKSINFNFIKNRFLFYLLSIIMIILSLYSIIYKGFEYGIDFTGGRSYIVKLENRNLNSETISKNLTNIFIEKGKKNKPFVTTYGENNKFKITTTYKYTLDNDNVDAEIEDKLFYGLKHFISKKITKKDFCDKNINIGIISSSKVGPYIADNLKKSAYISILISIIIVSTYIIIQFKYWHFPISTIIAITHDVILVLGIVSFFKEYLPFSIQVDQTFIASIITVIGYSMNDSIVILDRLRENLKELVNIKFATIVNMSIKETLSRTINTSLSTLLIVAIIFLFGGESIKGFMFTQILGVIVGTLSSIFIVTPLCFDIKNKF